MQDFGEILFGLSYLPTAQRLSFSMIKINNIKQEKAKEEETLSKPNLSHNNKLKSFLPDPYLRILMFNQSGRLVKKKKTTVKVNTKDPVFNETLNFEVKLQDFIGL